MSYFVDGPAAAVNLMTRRAPIVLRVVQNSKGNWDALDQLDDEPGPDEKIYVYQLHEPPTSMHLCCRGKSKGASGWYQIGKYYFLSEQPADEHLRTRQAWSNWCDANKERLMKNFKPDPLPAENPQSNP